MSTKKKHPGGVLLFCVLGDGLPRSETSALGVRARSALTMTPHPALRATFPSRGRLLGACGDDTANPSRGRQRGFRAWGRGGPMWASAPTGGRVATGAERPCNDTSSVSLRLTPSPQGEGKRRADVGIGPYGGTDYRGRGGGERGAGREIFDGGTYADTKAPDTEYMYHGVSAAGAASAVLCAGAL